MKRHWLNYPDIHVNVETQAERRSQIQSHSSKVVWTIDYNKLLNHLSDNDRAPPCSSFISSYTTWPAPHTPGCPAQTNRFCFRSAFSPTRRFSIALITIQVLDMLRCPGMKALPADCSKNTDLINGLQFPITLCFSFHNDTTCSPEVWKISLQTKPCEPTRPAPNLKLKHILF